MQVHGWAHELYLVLFGGWGALLACHQGWSLRGEWTLYREGPRADAVVVGGIRTVRLGFRTLVVHHDIEEPVVRFATINGYPVQATVRHSLPETCSTGDTVEIFYDPREPRKVLAVPGFTSAAKGRLIIVAIGALFLSVASASLLFGLPVETRVSPFGLIVTLFAGAATASRWAWRRRHRGDVMSPDGRPLGDDRPGA
jgi:hypothetical protein